MRIRTFTRVLATVSMSSLVAIAVLVFWLVHELHAATQEIRAANAIVEAVQRLRLVTFDYMLFHNSRSREQWMIQSENVRRLLVPDDFRQPRDREIIAHIQHRRGQVLSLFVKLTRSRAESAGEAAPDASRLAETQTLSRIVLLQQENIDNAFTVAEDAIDRMNATHLAASEAIGTSLISLALALGFTFWFSSRRVLAPLVQLSNATRAITSGNLDTRTGIHGHDEIADLSRDFDRMTASLRKSHAELERRTTQLVEANKELESFSYSVSHDLRAPLRAIDNFSKRLAEARRDQVDEATAHHLDRIRAAVKTMGQLIDDLLSLSRISRTNMSVDRVDLSALVQRVIEEFRSAEPQRQVETIVAPGAQARGDANMLEIAMRNLIGNSWKFTSARAAARIEFAAEALDGKTTYRVRDNGAGFDMAYADKLFAPFQRLHSMKEFPGTGIGLAIVQRIVHRHGGWIWAQAEVDQGAVFNFTLDPGGEHARPADIAG